MAIFLTGATGYIGSYVAAGLLERHSDRLALLVRAKSPAEAEERLWKSMQLHMGFERFLELVRTRCDLYLGDLTFPGLGLAPAARDALVRSMDSVLHVAASLNRKSSKACFNVNLRGTIHGVPAVMAGAWGSHLGVVDLVLSNDSGRWQVLREQGRAHLRPVYDKAARKALVESIAETEREEASANEGGKKADEQDCE